MADLLIKGMDMPERCIDCPLLLGYHSRLENKTVYHCTGRVPEDSRFSEDTDLSKRPEYGCPLIEVKPHGRLIDATELEAGQAILLGKEAWDMVHDAPTVLEASEGCDCTAPDCLDCERNDECNYIGLFEEASE